MPVMRSSVYGWRWPRMRSQPSSCVRKCQSLRCLPWETTSASTRAPDTVGAPSFTSAPSPTRRTSRSSFDPTSCASFSTLRRSPSLTRYCLPPVLTTAYIGESPGFPAWNRPGWQGNPAAGRGRVLCAGGTLRADAAGVLDVVVRVAVPDPSCAALLHLGSVEGERLVGVPGVLVDRVEHHRFRGLEIPAARP